MPGQRQINAEDQGYDNVLLAQSYSTREAVMDEYGEMAKWLLPG
jgi:hypothetical protein